MSLNNNMIDSMMGNTSNGKSMDDLEPPKRKSHHSFSDISNYLMWMARKLDILTKNDIPNAFPFSPPEGGSDPRYHHTPWEFMGADFSTKIVDGLYAISTVTEVLNILKPAKFVLTSLFPPSFDNGRMEVEIPDKFEDAKDMISKAIDGLENLQSVLQMHVQLNKFKAIDRKEMKKLDKHIIRLGYEYIKSGKIPQELIDQNVDTRPEIIAYERAILKNANMLPDMQHILMDSGKKREKNVDDMIMSKLKEW